MSNPKGLVEPTNKKLWNDLKLEIFAKYKKNSAYRSGALVKAYKEAGGTFYNKKNPKVGLSRWFAEEWKDIGGLDYPVYRPTKRITKETPLTISEIDKTQLKKQIKLKQKIKGESNLPKFKSSYILHAVIIHKPIKFEEAYKLSKNFIPINKNFYRETEQSYRFRNIPKTKFNKFKTKVINNKISLIYGKK